MFWSVAYGRNYEIRPCRLIVRGEQNLLHSELVQRVNVVKVFTVPCNTGNVGNC